MLELTTLARLKAWIGIDSKVAAAGTNVDMQLLSIIGDISQQIGEHCDAEMGVELWSERHALAMGQREIFPDNPLVRSVAFLRYDALGFFQEGSYSSLTEGTDFQIDPEGRRINLMIQWPMTDPDARIFWLGYYGGFAWSTDTSVYSVASVTGTIPTGSTTFSNGKVINVQAYDSDAATLTFTPISGCFWKGQTLTFAAGSLVLGSMVKDSVLNDHPQLEMACWIQAAYEWERRRSMGRSATTVGVGDTRYTADYKLLPSVREKLKKYVVKHQRF
jgi:hypothetical protein